jgi:hypothetical protein
MVKKTWNYKPKVVFYVVGTLFLATLLSGLVLLAVRIGVSPPKTAVSTENQPSTQNRGQEPTEEYKRLIRVEAERVSTISARVKDANNWLNIELPKINVVIDLPE